MALGSLVSKILLEVKADTSDAKAKLKELTGEQKRMQEQTIASIERSNKSIENQIKAIGLLGAGFAAVKGSIGLAKDGLDAYAKTSSEAKKQVDDLTKTLDSSFTEAKQTIGELVVAMGPLLDVMAKLVNGAVQFASALAKIPLSLLSGRNLFKTPTSGWGPTIDQSEYSVDSEAELSYDEYKALIPNDAFEAMSPEEKARFIYNNSPDLQASSKRAEEEGRRYREAQKRAQAQWAADHGYTVDWDEEGGSGYGARNFLMGGGGQGVGQAAGIGDQSGIQQALNQMEAATRGGRYADWQANKAGASNAGLLSQVFGPIEQFNLYTEAFQGLSDAVGGAMEAWITGSMSAGLAFKKFIAEALTGIATQMAIEALKHAAYAIGSAAFGDARGAGTHAAAAVKFAAGAALAATAARSMGHGGADYKAGGSGAPTATGGGGGGGEGRNTRTMVVVYGSDFADDSPRKRQLKAQRMVQTAIGAAGVTE